MKPAAKRENGVFIDTIDSLSDHLLSMSSLASLVPLLTMAYRARRPPPEEQERLATLLQTMSPAPAADYSRQNHLGSFVRFLSPVLNGLAGLRDYTEAVGACSKPEDFRDFWMLEGRNLIKKVVWGNALTGAVTATGVPFLDVFVKETSCRIALGRKSKALALVPADVEPGDELWQGANEESPTMRRALDMGDQRLMGTAINCRQCVVGGEPEKLFL